jgi:hypothetical protein
MLSIEAVDLYFGAERAASMLFVCIGLVAVELAVTCWRKGSTAQARGAALSLVMVAAIQLVVGATVFVRSPLNQARVAHAVQMEPARARADEVPRMQAVMRNFQLYRWAELALLLLGGLLALVARGGSWLRGVGLGLLPQAAVMLLLDDLAEQRGAAYLAWLLKL